MRLCVTVCCLLVLCTAAFAQEPVVVPVPRPEPLLAMDLGGGLSSYIISSHLQTGWARYLETVPGTVLRDGIGSWTACQQVREPADAERILGTLHDYGIGVFREEIGWGSMEYRTDLRLPPRLLPHVDAVYRAVLRAAKARGFRLIILLNAHEGMPCPVCGTDATYVENAAEGNREVVLRITDPSRVRVGYTGLSNVSGYCAAEELFQSVALTDLPGGNVYKVVLSQPLCKASRAGTRVDIHTLQYRPFGSPQSDPETYGGWGEYAGLLARIAAEGLPDGAVDFEVWNELSFGTRFLSIANYEADAKGSADQDRMMQVAADAIRQVYPAKATVLNGFANTTFFFGGFWSSARPAGVNGETYHPYGYQWREYPKAALGGHLAEGYRNVDGFLPRYDTLYPEYKGNHETSHTLISLMQPQMRQALVANGHAPAGWRQAMTENGIFIPELQLPPAYKAKLEARPEYYVAKFWLRLYPFFLNKGLYALCDGSLRNPGDWEQSWEAKFARTGDTANLAAMEPLKRMAALVRDAVPVAPERLIALHPEVTQLTGQDLKVFSTDGAKVLETGAEGRAWDPATVKVQPLYYRDVFCLLPFQTTDSSLAVAAYIQTRNFLDDVDDAGRYRIRFPGLKADPTRVRVYDPLRDANVPAEIADDGGVLSITLTLTDCPVWILLDNVDGERGTGVQTAP